MRTLRRASRRIKAIAKWAIAANRCPSSFSLYRADPLSAEARPKGKRVEKGGHDALNEISRKSLSRPLYRTK
jgi:hypothetical protein